MKKFSFLTIKEIKKNNFFHFITIKNPDEKLVMKKYFEIKYFDLSMKNINSCLVNLPI